ncbi:MAG: type II toxin-antitoxin system PemK/MazF family toxin [Candidatus Omnitrophota bacterium]|jgi:mRNA interferase MazF|nr:MAG: type II toxin-antitoxin system PemK/MazF family toxin [Candidatus Omnitrophota bacterium]
MKKAGQIALLHFPFTDLSVSKLRPVVLLRKLPGEYDDWLVCMISSRIDQYVEGLDEIIDDDSDDFLLSGLKFVSVIRTTRLAVVERNNLIGMIGEISQDRLFRIKHNLSEWIRSS